MPSARKKCICQICTCGRHICPHRKKSQVVIGCEEHSAKSVKVTSREEKLKQRKQWESRTEQQSVSLSTDQLNAQSLLASSENFASSVTVTDTGNRNGTTMRTEASNWSAKQIPKTLPIKRPDNLKAEGQAEFTTTHQRDFTKKSSEMHIKESSHTSSEMVQAESWNKRQIPKTQKIKKEDTLMLTGPLESETTHKASYNESTFKSKAQHSEQSESYKRPRTSLKMSGEFQSDSSYQEAFTPKQASDTYKVKKGESKSNLKLEGEMSFERTSTDYNAASSQINAEDITTVKAKKIRPDSEIKIPAVPISDETTLANDFKRWNVERPVIHKPKDTLTLGDSDATDLNTTFIIEQSSVTAENSKMETSISDYKNWEVTRPVVHKPENNLKSEGSFSFETTSDAAYSSRRSMANQTIDLEPLAERTETESIAQSVQEERTSVSIAKSEGDKRSADNGQIIETTEVMNRQESNGAVESNAISIHESSAVSVHESAAVSTKAESTTVITEAAEKSTDVAVEQSVRNESLAIEQKVHEDHEITSQSEDQTQYVSWDQIRPKPIRQHSSLRQEGGMEFNTTNRDEFIPRSVERVKGTRPKTNTKLFEGEFDATTMNQVMFSTEPGEKVTPFRPKSNLHLEDGSFNDETTSAREFQPWEVQRPAPVKPRSNLTQEGTMDFTTTNLTEFEGKMPEKVHPIRPTTTNRIESGEIDLNTTNRVMHPEFPIERVKKIVPQSTLRMNSGVFESETTNKSQFQDWGIERPKPIKPVSNLTQEGSMDFTTMNNLQFHEKPIEKVQQFRPHTTTKITGEFDGTTTNQVMFQDSPREKVHAFRPQDNLKLEGGDFTNESTTKKEFQNWEYVKQSPIKHDSTMRQEGDIDFSTTNRREYVGKTAEEVALLKSQAYRPQNNLKVEGGDFTSETTNKKEFQQWEYVKPSPIKHDSSMRQEGDMDFSTTMRREYVGKTPEEIALLKSQAYRPQDNLKLEGGDFNSESTTRREYVGKTAEKVSPIKPVSSTKVTGKFEGTTTNQAMFQDSPREKVKAFKPQDNLKLEGGDFANESTTKGEYQNWEYVKPAPIRHNSTMRQEGEIDFSTTSKSEFVGKTAQKVSPIKPVSSTKITGKFDGTTTNQAMFQDSPREKVQAVRPQNNLKVEEGNFASETTNRKEFQQWEYVKPSPIKPHSSMKQEGNIDFSTTNKREYVGKTAEEMALLKSQAYRPQDNLKLGRGDFTTESTTKTEFQNWEYVKPSPIRHDSTMRQEGDIDFSTTNKREYVGKTAEEIALLKSRAYRPQDNLKLEGGDFANESITKTEYQNWEYVKPSPIKHDSTMRQEGDIDFSTTNKREYVGKTAEEIALLKSRAYRPQDNLKLEGGDFANESITKTEYQNWEYVKPSPIKHDSTMKQEGEIDFSTTSRREYVEKTAEKVSPVKPVSSTKITGKFDGTTTNQAMFQDSPREKVKAFKPQDNLKLEGGDFADGSTTKTEFQNWEYVKPSPIKHDSTMRQEGEIDFSTTSRREYVGKTAEEIALLKSRAYRPQDNLKLEGGDFANESITKTEYQNWEYVKPSAIKHESTMRQEGNIDFSTTMSREYVGKTAEEIALLKSRAYRPQDNLKLEGGEFTSESTTKKEFQNWEYVKQAPVKHDSSMRQEGDIDFSTTSRREYVEKTAEKVSPVKPVSSTKITGKFDGTTTNQLMFQDSPREKVKAFKPHDNLKLEGGDFANESITKTEYQNWEYVKPSAIKHESTMRQEGDIDFSTTTRREYVGKTAEEMALLKSQAYRPHDNLKLEGGDFANESITKTEYQNWEYVKPSAIKHESTMRQEGDIDFSTTSRREYVEKTAEKVSPVKPVSSTKITGKFDGTTTNQAMFQDSPREKVKAFKPQDNLKLEGGDFADGSTTKAEFQNWEYVKAVPIKHGSTMRQEGEIDFSTTNRREYVGKTAEEIALLKSRAYKPQDNLKLEGGDFANESTTKTEYQNWEYVKPSPIKHDSTMKQEGDIDFSTTSRREYIGKTAEKVSPIKPVSSTKITGKFEGTTTNQAMYQDSPREKVKAFKPQDNLKLEGGDFTSESTTKKEFQNWEYVKPSPIKHDSTMRQEGDIDFSTTTRREYIGKTAEEIALLKSRAYKPQDNLKLEGGDFANQSTTKTEYQNWEYVKPSPIRHDSTMKQEGDIDFSTTTRREYVGKTAEKVSPVKPVASTKVTGKFEGTTTNQAMFQDSPREKVKAFKPQDNLKLEGGDFANESTTKKEYQNWEYVKPSPIKHESTMKQEGDIDFSTTTKREFVGKTAEKVSPVKPVSSTKISGEFDGTTTNQAMFQAKKSVEKVKGKRPQTNIQLEKGKFEDQTTARREFQQWEINKPKPIKPTGNLAQDGDMDFTTSNKTDFQPKSVPAVQPIRPKPSSPVSGEFDGTTTNKAMFQAQTAERVHDIRPKDNLRVDSGQFVGETTNSKEFSFKAGAKPEPIKPKSNLTQEGEFDFKTSNQTEFEQKQINKVSQIRPKTQTKTSDGKFYSTTTNQAMFQTPQMQNVHGIKPTDNLHVEKGKFQSNTTSTDEYQQWKVQKQKVNQLASSLKQEGNMQFETTNKTEFKERSFDKVKQIRPKTTNKLIEGDFDSTTTNQVMFQQHGTVERAKPIRHESNLRLEGGKFANETTNTREFRQWVKMENKDSQNKKKIEAAGVRSQKEKSEIKKDSGAQNIKVTGDKDQHEPWKLNKETGETIVKETKTVSGQSEIRLANDKTKTQSESQQLKRSEQQVKRSEETTQVVKSKVEVSKSDISMQKQEIETHSSQTTQRTNGERQHRVREISSVATDAGGKPSPKVKSIVPAGNLSSEGDMSFATTSQTDFSRQTATMSKSESKQMSSSVKEGSEMRSQKSVGNVKTRTSTGGNLFGEGDMSFVTTSKTAFSPQKTSGESKQMSSVQKGTVSRQSKVAVENEIALNATLSRRSVSKESLSKGMNSRDNSMSPQKTPTKTKRFRPEDNLKIEPVPFDATSTTRTEFQKWETRRSSSKKRNESLKQEGSMEFNVTSNDYSQGAYQANRDQIKAKSKADQRGSLGQSGAMEFHTTSNSSYTAHAGSYGTKSKTVRPRTSLKLGSEDATSKQDAMSSSRSNPEVSSGEFVSTSRAAYVTHTPSRRSVANRPPTNQKIGEGSFESQTTTRSSFTVHQGQVEKPRIVKHESHNILNTENGFTGGTTYRNSFETVRTHHCPVLDLEAGRSALSFNEEKNGHLFYAPNVQMNIA